MTLEEERDELVKTIKKRCEIYAILREKPEHEYLLPTVLEDLYEDSQQLALEHCVKES